LDEWRISPKENKRPAQDDDRRAAPLPRFTQPYELQTAWADWHDIQKEHPFQFWDGINEEELLGGTFWTNIAVEKVLENAAEEQEGYEKDNSHNVDWLTDLLDRGMHAIQGWLLALDQNAITPRNMVEHLAFVRENVREQLEFGRDINGLKILQNNARTQWTRKEPKNKMTWLNDILGDWKEETEGKAATMPLSRMLSTLAIALTFNQAQCDIFASRDDSGANFVNQVGMQWHANYERISSRRFISSWVRKTLSSLEEPEETTKIDILGHGEKHWMIWLADKSSPQIWLWKYGGKISRKHQTEILRLAKNTKLHQEESEALEKLARWEWNEQNVKECIDAFFRRNVLRQERQVVHRS